MSDPGIVPDQALIVRCLHGDQYGREEFFTQCKTWFVEFIRRGLFRNGTPWDWVEDVTAMALEALVADNYRRLRAFQPARAPLPTFLAAIARDQFNLFLRGWYRQKKRETHLNAPPNKSLDTEDDHLEFEIEEIATLLTPKEKWHYQKCALEIPSEEILASDSPANRRKLNQRIRDKLRAYQQGTGTKSDSRTEIGQGIRSKTSLTKINGRRQRDTKRELSRDVAQKLMLKNQCHK